MINNNNSPQWRSQNDCGKIWSSPFRPDGLRWT